MPPSSPNESRNSDTDIADPPLLHDFFERSARLWPQRIALDIPTSSARRERKLLTYSDVKQQSDALAGFLSSFVSREAVVAILLPRSGEHLYISQLAALKSGAAYTCLDPSFPGEQIHDTLIDSGAVVLLTDTEGCDRLRDLGIPGIRVFDVSKLMPQIRVPDDSSTPAWLTPESLAYIIYTSGTTGRPKGVMIEHRSIANLVGSDVVEFQLSPADRVAQNSSPAYDSSLEEIWLAFAAGATLVVMDEEAVRLGPDLVSWLQNEQITVLCPPPTLLRTTGCLDPESALPRLSLVYVGGEALPGDVAERWAKGRRLVNGYGPTECTVTCLRDDIRAHEPITIGRPIPGASAWVLNESLEEVPTGEPGELCLGGIGLARGYRNRPELTDQKFPVHPRLGRLYRTGDLVHRDAADRFFYHGRIDSQVKLRGYRVELEAIEARLSECAGVREAACRVQGNGAQQLLVAFVVPETGVVNLSLDDLKESLTTSLPSYMVPSRFATIAELPTTVGGKLNRNALPIIEASLRNGQAGNVAPRNLLERKIEAAFRKVLHLPAPCSIDDDFFSDLGGDSLRAAELISQLRNDPSTASLTVRDLYEKRSVAGVAERSIADLYQEMTEETGAEEGHEVSHGRPILTTAAQLLWIGAGLVLGSLLAYSFAILLVPLLIRNLGVTATMLGLGPLILLTGLLVYTPLALLLLLAVKRIFIGRYRTLTAPVWGSFYLRNWIVQQTARLLPWSLVEGTVFQIAILRVLGARIGRRVHIHRGVNLHQGGWDLLEIGDDVTIGQEASLRLVDLDNGTVIVGAVSLGDRCTLEARSGVGGNCSLEEDAYLSALSSLDDGEHIPRGELWDGIPARPAGKAPPRPAVSEQPHALSPLAHGILCILAQLATFSVLAVALMLPATLLLLFHGISTESALAWLSSPRLDGSFVGPAILAATVAVPFMVVTTAVLSRALGRVRPGTISLWSPAYVRVWIKSQLVQVAGKWLAGALFWPVWLRWAGMKVGRGCEISTIIDVVPDLVSIGEKTFFADGIYLGGPQIHRGVVSLAETSFGANDFLGNHVVVPMGQHLPSDVLLGICTIADDTIMRPGTAWFGHPPFELPRREVVELDRRVTYAPTPLRYVNRLFWELLRFALPIVPLLAFVAWLRLVTNAGARVSSVVVMLLVAPAASLITVAFFCMLVLGLKWLLLGRARPGLHAFWSCWCCRWDFLYMAWEIYGRAPLSWLEGTLVLSSYLRAMGARIGRRVVLGGGFAQVVDPDMLDFEDGATVSCQLQAHTFEDRVLKIDRVTIRRGATVGHSAVLLYGAEIGIRTHVAPHSVVMKRESLLTGRSYAGCPTHPVRNTRLSLNAGEFELNLQHSEAGGD